MKPDLILSAAHDLGFDELRPFLLSLRKTGSKAQVHLFLSGIRSAEDREKIESYGVTTEPLTYVHFRRRRPLMLLWPLWKHLLRNRDFAAKRRLAEHVFFFVSLRHLLYLEFLLKHQGEYGNVMLSDCRDVYFQRDPFATAIEPGIHFYQEASSMSIGTNRSNSNMVRSAFGPGILQEMSAAPISCAGVTIGDEASIVRYLDTMVQLICGVRQMTSSNDQGIHNFVVQRQLVPNAHVHDNYSHLVFTAGSEPVDEIRTNGQDEIVRADGEAYAILHQHDRFPQITNKLLARLDG